MAPDLRKIPLSSIVALTAITFFCACLAFSIANYPPGFTPLKNWMSDLGNPLLNPAGSAYFNCGCMITGLFLIVFYIGLRQWRSPDGARARTMSAAQAAGIFSGIALAGVGYFPETFSPHHLIVSVLFFVSSTLAILLATLALRGHPGFGRAAACAGYISVVVGVIFAVQVALLNSVRIFEWMSVFSMLSWAALAGIEMARA